MFSHSCGVSNLGHIKAHNKVLQRTPMSTSEKNAALAEVANGVSIVPAGNAKARIGKVVVTYAFAHEI